MDSRASLTSHALDEETRSSRRRTRRQPLRRPVRIISGGQTGVDRAALDAALAAGVDIGGWCPRGRRAEDGPISNRYPLHETPSGAYAERTRWNVRDSDATLILARGPLTGGTSLTRAAARQMKRPVLVIDAARVSVEAAADQVRCWIDDVGIQILNVAGPRESTCPGIYAWSLAVLSAAAQPGTAAPPKRRRKNAKAAAGQRPSE